MNVLQGSNQIMAQDPSVLTKVSPVNQALNKLDGQVEYLANLISKHDSALSACLRGAIPPAQSANSEPRAIPESELVDRIEKILGRVTSACYSIEDLTARVTL